MPTLIEAPKRIQAAGNKPKLIDEFVGRANSGESRLSIAHMRSPGGWVEPGQTPRFEEFTIVLKGMVRVENHGGALDVHAGQVGIYRHVADGDVLAAVGGRAGEDAPGAMLAQGRRQGGEFRPRCPLGGLLGVDAGRIDRVAPPA